MTNLPGAFATLLAISLPLLLGYWLRCWIRDRFTDYKLRRGMKAAQRYGWLPEKWL